MPSSNHRLLRAMRELDERLAEGDAVGARRSAERFNVISKLERKTPAAIRDIIKHRGIRLRFLEDALKVDKVVVQPSVDIKHNLVDVFRGASPRISVQGGSIQIKITF